jgi:glycosyltransferase involved in cell wall biosynthesis
MERFERNELHRYDAVIAVSERDKTFFESRYALRRTTMIPTGVNLTIHTYRPPPADGPARVVFSGAMDWLANIDAIEFFMEKIWPRVAATKPEAQFVVVGHSPPARLVAAARNRNYRWTFTGYVDDVRPHVRSAQISVIPLRVAGGTRLKVYEAMAMGCPVVSTAIGVEGLPLDAGKHFELADEPETFANAIIRLLDQPLRRAELAQNARRYIEEDFSHKRVAAAFEEICAAVCRAGRSAVASPA